MSEAAGVKPMIYRFHAYELDDDLYQLRRDGEVVAVEPKVFNVLVYLIQHHDRVVSKDELRAQLWPGQVISEAALVYCLVEARKAVGDDGRTQRVIKTQHGRGYRFIAPVSTTAPPVVSSQHLVVSSQHSQARISQPGSGKPQLTTENWRLTPLSLADQPSIAVLPFTNLSDDPRQEYFSDGFTEDLITDLSKLSGLFVIARHSVFTYKGKMVKVEEIGRELGVQYVLEGSVRKADDQVRTTAQLVDATTGHHLWAERYDRPLKDIFTLQDELRQKIITALKVKLLPEEQARFQRAPTHNLEAYDYYLRGVESYRRLTPEANIQAQQMFARAIELDPRYAAASAFLSLTCMARWLLLWSQDPQLVDQALSAVQRALVLDDTLAGAHAILSWVCVWKGLYQEALAAAHQATVLDPHDADSCSFVAQTLNFAGRPEEALQLAETAIQLNPAYPPQYISTVGWAYLLLGRYEQAIVALKKAIALNSEWAPPHVFLAISYNELNRHAEAQAEAAEILRIAPNLSLELMRQRLPYKDPTILERQLAALRKAGLQ
jgi:TolB-like protein/Flp pilus assembly protein TadD